MSDGFMIAQYRNHWTGPQDRIPIAYRPVEGGFLAALFGGGTAAAAQQVANATETDPAKPAAATPVTEPRAAARPVDTQSSRFAQARPQRSETGGIPAAAVTEPSIAKPPVDLTTEQFNALMAANRNPFAPPGAGTGDIASRMQQGLDKYEAQFRGTGAKP